jgi:cell division protein FtsI/penicillin-binding protein 2
MIGMAISSTDIARILKKLGFEISATSDNEQIYAKVPLWRHDIVNSHDICEEIVRIIGIDNIPAKALEFSEKNRTNESYERYKLSRNIVMWDTQYQVYSSIVQITWTPTNTITTGIGQSITTVTPIGVARYISALVNGGYVYDAHIVDKVTTATGELVYEQTPTLVRKLDIADLASIVDRNE